MLNLTDFRELHPYSENYFLMATVAVPAGEPVEIELELEKADFNEYLTGGASGVYLIHVEGDSMEAAIFHGDVLVVNRNLQPNAGDKVVARVGSSYTVTKYIHLAKTVYGSSPQTKNTPQDL